MLRFASSLPCCLLLCSVYSINLYPETWNKLKINLAEPEYPPEIVNVVQINLTSG